MVGFFVPASGLFERLRQRLFYIFLFTGVYHCHDSELGDCGLAAARVRRHPEVMVTMLPELVISIS